MHIQKCLPAAVAAAVFAKNFLSTAFGGGRGVVSLSNKNSCFFFQKKITLWKPSDDTELYTTMAFDRVCQNCSPFVLRSG